MAEIEMSQLKQRLSMSLDEKIKYSKDRIMEWYAYWDSLVYVAFSGGKDSTVLSHLVRSIYPDVPLVFCDTGLEYPEIIKFINTFKDKNLVILKPKKIYKEVIDTYGYPIVSKENADKIYDIRNTKSEKLRHKRLHGNNTPWKSGKLPEKWKYLINSNFKISGKCCDVMKKRPALSYFKQTKRAPYDGSTVGESLGRRQTYIRHGCNAYRLLTRPRSTPIAIWSEEDIWAYIQRFKVPYSKIYDMGYSRTGCIYCGFGVHMESGLNKFQRLKKTHPTRWKYCMDNLGLREVMKVYGVPIE